MKLGKILKICFISMLVIFLSFIAIRIFMSSDRSCLDSVFPTDAAKTAYESYGESAFTTNPIPSDMSADGYFTAYALAYCESEKELQITVRYNESLPENYLIGSDPDKYYFELRDAEGNTVSSSRTVDTKDRYFYRHLRLAFSDVESDSELYLFLICEECAYPADHTDGILVRHPSLESKHLKLSKNEKSALSE
ncbi:MAG: hypothetical protein E7647_00920 [Ruminococcaceae bacterium]|nr:hypothetical protein [Oscillospiraceae bacterium]